MARNAIGRLQMLAPVIVPTTLPYRIPEPSKVYLTDLRLALDQEP